ncbi:uncharacterized protein [Montipora foliosa]|uniref:uncharacterized protein isoform X3 n=1 Tax=Montipora foliosa TaxID=591990 RepID=UPI0035F1968D
MHDVCRICNVNELLLWQKKNQTLLDLFKPGKVWDFRAMASSSWIRCVISSFFVYTTLPYHAEGFKKTTRCDGDSHCTGPDEKLYNLAPLQKEGEPRFREARKKGSDYYFAYNPCGSFKLGSTGDCSGDVAICMWTLTETYQNVGIHKTSMLTIFQGTNGSSTGFIEYRNERKSVNSASFRVITEDNGKSQRIFKLRHICACGDGCPLLSTKSTQSVKPSLALPIGITMAFVVLVPLVVIWIYCRRFIRHVGNNPQEQPLINNLGEGKRSFVSADKRKKNMNVEKTLSEPMTSGPSCDIAVSNKDLSGTLINRYQALACEEKETGVPRENVCEQSREPTNKLNPRYPKRRRNSGERLARGHRL